MLGLSRDEDDRDRCPACGDPVRRSVAREYDKFGDRWDRTDKDFEYFCKACHEDLCHQERPDLEALLVAAHAGEGSQEAFIARYMGVVTQGEDSVEELG